MKCPQCNYESDNNFEYCPSCGTSLSVAPLSLNPAGDIILNALNSKLFLLICILMTFGAVITLFSGSGIPIINVLFSIFLWITYSCAKKGFADEKQLKNLSGTVYANYIITNVACVLLFVLGAIFGAVVTLLASDTELMNEIFAELTVDFPNESIDILNPLFEFSGWFFFAIFTVIAAIGILINVLCFKKIHRFAKSVYKSVENCTPQFEYANFSYKYLIVFAILNLIGSCMNFSEIAYFLSTASMGTATILSAILIKKYILNADFYEVNYAESNQ